MKQFLTIMALFFSLGLGAQETEVLMMTRQHVYLDDGQNEHAEYILITGMINAEGKTSFLTELNSVSSGQAVMRLFYDANWTYDTYEGLSPYDTSLQVKSLSVAGTGENANISLVFGYDWDMDTDEESFELRFTDATGTKYSLIGIEGEYSFSRSMSELNAIFQRACEMGLITNRESLK